MQPKQAILENVPKDAACPQCRTRGVFAFAIQLHETERLIKQRCAVPPCRTLCSLACSAC
jgi:hypothetical protein